jgi:hypothetical protein
MTHKCQGIISDLAATNWISSSPIKAVEDFKAKIAAGEQPCKIETPYYDPVRR